MTTGGGLMMTFPILETERLHLVEIGQEFRDNYFGIMSLDEVTKYYGMESLKNVEQASKIIESFSNNFLNKRAIRWGIKDKDNQEFIGTLGFNNVSLLHKRAEIGYEIHPHYWRSGYTSEAIKEVLRYAFEELDLYRVGAVIFPENTASIRLIKKMGFVEEGLLRGYLFQHNQSNDALMFSLIKSEWEMEGR